MGKSRPRGDAARPEGGNVADADVVLVAVPGGALAKALGSVTGLMGPFFYKFVPPAQF